LSYLPLAISHQPSAISRAGGRNFGVCVKIIIAT
jgi:hypothetical protein